MTDKTLQIANGLQKEISALKGHLSVLDTMATIKLPQQGSVSILVRDEVIPIPYEIIQSVAILVSEKTRSRIAELEAQFKNL